MPSKRTNDSVDRILEELSHEQAERGIRDSVTDRQVDAILQSLGHGSMEESSGGGSALGPIQKEASGLTKGRGCCSTGTTARQHICPVYCEGVLPHRESRTTE